MYLYTHGDSGGDGNHGKGHSLQQRRDTPVAVGQQSPASGIAAQAGCELQEDVRGTTMPGTESGGGENDEGGGDGEGGGGLGGGGEGDGGGGLSGGIGDSGGGGEGGGIGGVGGDGGGDGDHGKGSSLQQLRDTPVAVGQQSPASGIAAQAGCEVQEDVRGTTVPGTESGGGENDEGGGEGGELSEPLAVGSQSIHSAGNSAATRAHAAASSISRPSGDCSHVIRSPHE